MFAHNSLLAFIGSFWQLAIVLGFVLLMFGSTRLPELMRSLGRSVTEFKKGINEGAEDEEKKDKEKIDKN